jgi:hypothetical protein
MTAAAGGGGGAGERAQPTSAAISSAIAPAFREVHTVCPPASDESRREYTGYCPQYAPANAPLPAAAAINALRVAWRCLSCAATLVLARA